MAFRLNEPPQVKAITSIPGWALHGWSQGKITTAREAYNRIPVVRRGVDIIADSLTSIPYYFRRNDTGKTEVEWPYDVDFERLLGDTVRAYLIEGAGYWLKLKNRVANKGIQWLNPVGMQEPKYDGMRDDGTIGIRFKQNPDATGGQKGGEWTEGEIVYFRQWHIDDDVTPGTSVVRNIQDNALLHHYITQYGKNTFENGAMPYIIMAAEGNPGKEEMDRGQNFFQRAITGVGNAMRVLVLKGVWKPTVVTPPLNTLAMPELAEYAMRQVAVGMGIPETMLADAANYATAQAHDLQFWRNTIVPLAEYFQHIINEQLLDDLGICLDFSPKEMDIFQEDEKERSLSLLNYCDAGYPLALASQILGIELPGEMTWDQFEKEIADKQPMLQRGGRAVVAQDPIPPPKDVTPPSAPAKSALGSWQRFAEKRIGAGKALRAFETDEVPAAMKGAIEGALVKAQTVADVQRIFRNAQTWQGYP